MYKQQLVQINNLDKSLIQVNTKQAEIPIISPSTLNYKDNQDGSFDVTDSLGNFCHITIGAEINGETIKGEDIVKLEGFKLNLVSNNNILTYSFQFKPSNDLSSVEISDKTFKTFIEKSEGCNNFIFNFDDLKEENTLKKPQSWDYEVKDNKVEFILNKDYNLKLSDTIVIDPTIFTAGISLATVNSPVNNSNFNVSSVTFNVTSNASLSWCGVSINNSANVTMGNTSSTAFNYTNTSIADGSYNFTITCNDSAGTFGNSGINKFLIDTIIPTLNVTSPVNSSTYNSSSVLFNVSSSEEGTGSIIPDIDNSLVSWWRMDDVNATTGVTDYMGRNNGTRVNAVQTDAGKLGKGMSFDGNSFINIISLNWSTSSYWAQLSGIWKYIVYNGTSTFVNGVAQCSDGMAYINKLGGYCIDKYEASTPGCEIVGNNCANYTHADYCPTICIPTVGVLGGVNSATGTTALAYSKENVAPLVGVSQKQARQMCANAGKHLCTDEKWMGASNIKGQVYNLPSNLKDAPYRCVTDSTTYCNYAANLNKACNTTLWSGGNSNCSSAEGVYDMVGNVWEWTNETVYYTKPCNTPVEGYCYINATSGDWQTSSTSPVYGNDGVYFIANTTTNKAVQRGGAWDSGADAGPLCAGLYGAPSGVSRAIGFRCCSGQG